MTLKVLEDNNTFIDEYYLGEPESLIILKMVMKKYLLEQVIKNYCKKIEE